MKASTGPAKSGIERFGKTSLTATLPLLVGITLGNLDPACRTFFGKATPPLIPFFAFALGSTLDLHKVVEASLLGVGLGLGVVAFSGLALFMAH